MSGGRFTSNFGIHVAGLIPVQVVATDAKNNDYVVGDFEGGVVLKGLDLMDVKTRQVVASFSMRNRMWVIKGKPYIYVFTQVKPQD